MAATDIVRAFEEDVQNHVTLAFFVVRVVYLADAVEPKPRPLCCGLSVVYR